MDTSTVTVPVADTTPVLQKQSFRLTAWDCFALLLPLLGMSPMLYKQAMQLNSELHLAYVPLVLVAVIVFSIYHLCSADLVARGRMFVASAVLLIACAIYAFAVAGYSPWLAHVSAVVVFLAWSLGRWGNARWPHAFAVSTLLATTLRWPNNLDGKFSTWLQQVSADWTSAVLDTFQITNYASNQSLSTQANTFELAATTSYGSIFALFAIVVLIGILRHRSFFHCILLTLTAPIWFATSISLMMLGCVWLGQDYATALQAVVFVIALVFLMMTDQFLSAMLFPVPYTDPEVELQFALSNQVLIWPQPHPEMEHMESPDDDDDEYRPARANVSSQDDEVEVRKVRWSEFVQLKWAIPILSLIFVALGVLPTMAIAKNEIATEFRALSNSEVQSVFVDDVTAQESMPPAAGVWRRMSVEPLEATNADAGIRFRYLWNGEVVDVTVVFPKSGWDGRVRLSLDSERKELEQSFPATERGWFFSVARTSNAFEGKRYTWQTAITADGKPFMPLIAEERLLRQEEDRLPIMRMLKPLLKADLSPTFHVRADCETGKTLSDDEVATFRQSLEEFCVQLASKIKPEQLEQFKQ